jgi:hypothetical protein
MAQRMFEVRLTVHGADDSSIGQYRCVQPHRSDELATAIHRGVCLDRPSVLHAALDEHMPRMVSCRSSHRRINVDMRRPWPRRCVLHVCRLSARCEICERVCYRTVPTVSARGPRAFRIGRAKRVASQRCIATIAHVGYACRLDSGWRAPDPRRRTICRAAASRYL